MNNISNYMMDFYIAVTLMMILVVLVLLLAKKESKDNR